MRSAKAILAVIGNFDALRLTLPALVILPLLAWQWGQPRHRFLWLWMLMTVAVYSGGFLLVYFETRYVESFLWPLCCLYLLGPTAVTCREMLGKSWSDSKIRNLTGLLLVASLAVPVSERAIACIRGCSEQRMAERGSYRTGAAEIEAAGCVGPIAYGNDDYNLGLFISYHMNEQYFGVPQQHSAADIDTALQHSGVNTFLVDAKWSRKESYRMATSWRHHATVTLCSTNLEVYVPPNE